MFNDIAEKYGIKTPPTGTYCKNDYLHYHIYSLVCATGAISLKEYSQNAEVISNLSEEDLHSLTIEKLIELGGAFHENIPTGNYYLDEEDGVFKLDEHV